jgi:hypothetical protein
MALVLALHLFSTSGTWWTTDHGEILAVAHNVVSTGRFDVQDLGPGWEEWTRIASARHDTRTRFLPVSVLSLVPFLLLDHAFGRRALDDLRFVHLQGHIFVGVALWLAGRFVMRATRSSSAAALCVLLAGFNWPVWMIARRIGPEPVLLALLVIFITQGTFSRAIVLIVLPWTHATGPLLALGAMLWLISDLQTLRGAAATRLLPAFLLGPLTVALFWNLPVHGHLFLGGYDRFASGRDFGLRNPLVGLASLLAPLALWVLPLWWLVLRSPLRSSVSIVGLWAPLSLFLGLLSHPELLPSPEPERRTAPLIVASIAACLVRTGSFSRASALGLFFLALISGVVGLSSDFVAVTNTPLGLFSGPHLFFLRLAFEEGRPWPAAGASAILLATAAFAASRTFKEGPGPAGAVGSNGVSPPESSA